MKRVSTDGSGLAVAFTKVTSLNSANSPVRHIILSDAKESFGHAQQVGDKIVALGGVPVATRNEIQQSRDLQEIFTFSLAFESKAVEMYSKAIELAGDDKPLVVFLEDILKEEQDGVDEYTKLMRTSNANSATTQALKSA